MTATRRGEHSWIAYAASALIASAAAVLVLQLWRANLRVPFDYGGDSLLLALPVKAMVAHGWYLTNGDVGAPSGLDLHDYPFVANDTLHLLLLKLMSCFSHDWALLFNVYFLLAFPLIALSATAVFRAAGVGPGPAVTGAVLFAFLPSRLLTGESHLFLGTFYQVPLAVLTILWVTGDDPPFATDRGPGRWPALEMRRPRTLATLAISALTASTGLYYAYFAACLALVGGIWAAVERRSSRNAVAGGLLALALFVGVVANGLPTLVYHLRHGPNPEVATRTVGDAETFGLKVTQLLLPVEGHRIPALRRLNQRYGAATGSTNENTATSLGLVGSAGFLILLYALLSVARNAPRNHTLLRTLAVLNLLAVLIATTGGFGSLVALLVTPQVRTYARMSVIIAFLSLFAVVLLLDRGLLRRPLLAAAVLPAILFAGLFDQASLLAVRPYGGVEREYSNARDLVRTIEARLPAGAIVFQLPYVTFPEAPGLARMSGLDQLAFYLHARTSRWNWPTMRGRSGDRWARDVAARPPAEMVAALADAGMRGIVVDRDGYSDQGAGVEWALAALLETAPVASANRRFAFFDMTTYCSHHPVRQLSEWRRTLELHPLVFRWANGCYGEERDGKKTFRWCGPSGELQIDNDTSFDRVVSIDFSAVVGRPPARLTIRGDVLSADVELGPTPTRFTRLVRIPPGYHLIRFRSDGQRLDPPGDARALVWRAEDPVVQEAPLDRENAFAGDADGQGK